MYKSLLALDYLHSRGGLCHNGLSSFCIWMSTTNQLEIAELEIKITDLGSFVCLFIHPSIHPSIHPIYYVGC